MRTFKTLLKKVLVFSLGPLLASVASLLALPALTEKFGAEGWASIAIGLSVGTGASVFVELGWGLDGPPRVSRASNSARTTIFALSTATKVLTFPAAAAAAAVISASIAADFKLEAALTAVASAALGLSAAWYFIGSGTPWILILTDSTPKVVFTVAAAGVLYLGAPLLAYPTFLLLGPTLSLIIAVLVVMRGRLSVFRALSFWRVSQALRGQITALRGRASSALYLALPAAILGVVAPSQVASFAGADRLQRMALTFLQVVPNAMVSWAASERDITTRWTRVRTSIILNSSIGLVAGFAWVFAMNLLARWVFSDKVTIPTEIVWLSAYLIWVTCTSRAVGGIGLVTFGGVKHVSNSAGAGAVVGAILFVALGAQWGAVGAFFALTLTETIVLAWQLWALRHLMR